MNRILVASIRISASYLAKKLAEDNPAIQVDLLGAKIEGKLPPNLTYLGEVFNGWEGLVELQKIYQHYDFIYAADFAFQFSHRFQKWKNSVEVPILCPERRCSFLEFNKLGLKKILNQLGIPNAEYEVISEDDLGSLSELTNPVFLSGDKFVLKLNRSLIFNGSQTNITDISQYKELVLQYRYAGGDFFVEKFIKGREMSAHFLCNGSEYIYLGSARDYKKLRENDEGENVSSTGCYSPVEYIDDNIKKQMFSYVEKILSYLNQHGIKYHGIMYLGLIIDENNIVNVLELNSRPGNPEFGTIVNTIGSKNLLENLYNAATGKKMTELTFSDNAAVSINIVNQEYFRSPTKPTVLPEIEFTEDDTVVYFTPVNYKYSIYATVLRTGKSVSEVAEDFINYIGSQKLNDFRIRKDIGKLL